MSCLQHAKGALVAHTNEAAQSKFQDHAALEGDKVPYILEQEELWPVVVAVAQVSGHQRVLDKEEEEHKEEEGHPTQAAGSLHTYSVLFTLNCEQAHSIPTVYSLP